MSRVTLKNIAEELGLGVTTVSRALSDASDISEATKTRVRNTAQSLGYRRNLAGAALRTGRTGTLSFILNPHDDLVGYGSQLLHGLSEGLRGTDLTLNVIPDFLGGDPVAPVAQILSRGSSDGVIFSQTRPQDLRARLALEQGLAFVTHGRTELATPHASYDFDNRAFATQAVQRLAARGAKRIALIAPPHEFLYAHHMELGLQDGLAQTGCSRVEDAPRLTLNDNQISDWAAQTDADGIVCAGERATLAVVRGLTRPALLAAKHTSALLPLAQPHIDLCFEDLAETGRRLASLMRARLDGADETQLTEIQRPQWARHP